MTNYEQQAQDFLQSTNTKFSTSFKAHDFYFPEDKGARDIYYVTLKNDRHRYRFTFGQSITNAGKAPTPYAVLASLTKCEVGTFEDFCSDYGYDTDSRKAYKTYKAVLREWKNIEKLYTSEELEQLQEIQ